MKLPRYIKHTDTKLRQNEYGNYYTMEVKIMWWYVAWVYAREFFKALGRLEFKNKES